MKSSFVATLLAALVVCLATGLSVAYAGGSTVNGTGHCDLSDPACTSSLGLDPLFGGPAPPFISVQGDCPAFLFADPWVLSFVDGSAVFHGTANKNGDWGGFTAQGSAVLTSSDDTVQYAGHATEWGGGGNNSGGQGEGGFTFNYTGSGPAGAISIHANGHMTTNNAGMPTSNVSNATLICS